MSFYSDAPATFLTGSISGLEDPVSISCWVYILAGEDFSRTVFCMAGENPTLPTFPPFIGIHVTGYEEPQFLSNVLLEVRLSYVGYDDIGAFAAFAAFTTTELVSGWIHICGTVALTENNWVGKVYVGGVQGASTGGTGFLPEQDNMVLVNSVGVGTKFTNSNLPTPSGDVLIAEMCFWSGYLLTGDDIEDLAGAVCAWSIQTASVVFYWDGNEPFRDVFQGIVLEGDGEENESHPNTSCVGGPLRIETRGVDIGGIIPGDFEATSLQDSLLNGPNRFILTLDDSPKLYVGEGAIPIRQDGKYTWSFGDQSGVFIYKQSLPVPQGRRVV